MTKRPSSAHVLLSKNTISHIELQAQKDAAFSNFHGFDLASRSQSRFWDRRGRREYRSSKIVTSTVSQGARQGAKAVHPTKAEDPRSTDTSILQKLGDYETVFLADISASKQGTGNETDHLLDVLIDKLIAVDSGARFQVDFVFSRNRIDNVSQEELRRITVPQRQNALYQFLCSHLDNFILKLLSLNDNERQKHSGVKILVLSKDLAQLPLHDWKELLDYIVQSLDLLGVARSKVCIQFVQIGDELFPFKIPYAYRFIGLQGFKIPSHEVRPLFVSKHTRLRFLFVEGSVSLTWHSNRSSTLLSAIQKEPVTMSATEYWVVNLTLLLYWSLMRPADQTNLRTSTLTDGPQPTAWEMPPVPSHSVSFIQPGLWVGFIATLKAWKVWMARSSYRICTREFCRER